MNRFQAQSPKMTHIQHYQFQTKQVPYKNEIINPSFNRENNELTIEKCFDFLKNEIEKKDLRIKELEEQVESLTLQLQSLNSSPANNTANISTLNPISPSIAALNKDYNTITLSDKKIRNNNYMQFQTPNPLEPESSYSNMTNNTDINSLLANKNKLINNNSNFTSPNYLESNRINYNSESEKIIKTNYSPNTNPNASGANVINNQTNSINHSYIVYNTNNPAFINTNNILSGNANLNVNGINATKTPTNSKYTLYSGINTASNTSKNIIDQQSQSRTEVKMFLSEVKEKVEPPIFKEFIKNVKLLTNKNNNLSNRNEIISKIKILFGDKYADLFEKFNSILCVKKE